MPFTLRVDSQEAYASYNSMCAFAAWLPERRALFPRVGAALQLRIGVVVRRRRWR